MYRHMHTCQRPCNLFASLALTPTLALALTLALVWSSQVVDAAYARMADIDATSLANMLDAMSRLNFECLLLCDDAARRCVRISISIRGRMRARAWVRMRACVCASGLQAVWACRALLLVRPVSV